MKFQKHLLIRCILDEAMSSIDTRTEVLVQKEIWMNRKKYLIRDIRSCLLIRYFVYDSGCVRIIS